MWEDFWLRHVDSVFSAPNDHIFLHVLEDLPLGLSNASSLARCGEAKERPVAAFVGGPWAERA